MSAGNPLPGLTRPAFAEEAGIRRFSLAGLGIYSQPSVLAPTTDQRSVRAARSASHRKGRIEPMLGTAGLSLLVVSLVLLGNVVPRNGQGSGRPELLDILIALVLSGGITSGLLLTLAAVLG
jgi:hypothetical protein